MIRLTAAVLCLAITPLVGGAQALRDIGRTAAGNPVFVEPATVRRTGDSVSAIVRVRFAKAVRARTGEWWSSRTRLTIACAPRQAKILENWYFADTTWRSVADHPTIGAPAFGTILGGSMVAVAHTALCTPNAGTTR
jgi:hypothetical protein